MPKECDPEDGFLADWWNGSHHREAGSPQPAAGSDNLAGLDPRWNELLGSVSAFFGGPVPGRLFENVFCDPTAFERFQEIQRDTGVDVKVLLRLCFDSSPVGLEKAPSRKEIRETAAWIENDAKPRLQRILSWLRSPLFVSLPSGRRVPRSPTKIPRRLVSGMLSPISREDEAQFLRILEGIYVAIAPWKDDGDTEADGLSKRIILTEALNADIWTRAHPGVRERNLAEEYFLEHWERPVLRLAALLGMLENRAEGMRQAGIEEERRMGESGNPTPEWDRLHAAAKAISKRITHFRRLHDKVREVRRKHGPYLLRVIFGGEELSPDAYRMRVASLE